ncbi:MAG: protein kinase domain-containing protein [Gammaproteobacteria bacterium]
MPATFVQLLHTAYSAEPPFLVYEYVDGGDLTSWCADLGARQPDIDQCMRILMGIADALACAHRLDIVHRDLKPANILP